jgi:RNA polymerase sigma factor (sigma-70 family)
MRDDTKIGGAGTFPLTRWSLIAATRSSQPEERRRALNTLIAVYWKPVYKYIRLRWHKENEEGKDLTQEFFSRLLEKDFLGSYDAKRAKLRTFLRVCVDRFMANQEKASRRLKRGGEAQFLPLEFEAAKGGLMQIEIPAPAQMDEFFEREWARSVFALSLERLREDLEKNGKQTHFQVLQLTYELVAQRFGLKSSDVTNYLAYARREFRRTVLEQLREMTASEEEFQREARSLLGEKVELRGSR